MVLVTAYPMLQALYLSLFKYRLTTPDDRSFVGLGNYVTVLGDSLFWRDTFNTVLIMVVTVAVELVIGFVFAMVMHRIVFARGAIRTAILIPYGIITVVSAFAWQFTFSLNNGWVNSAFAWLPGISADTNWFGAYGTSMFAIMISEIWKTTPFMSLLLLAGLSQVSEDMIEAAKVDGATWWQRLRKVILPNMRAAIMVAVLFRALDAFRIFDNIFVMTKGAQGTASSSFLTYTQVIEQFQLGLGSALSVLLTERRTAIGTGVGFVVILVWCLLPVVWIISLSFKGVDETAAGSAQFLPKDPTLQNYKDILANPDFLAALRNSLGISLIATLLSVVLATLAAYAIARLEFKGKRVVLSIALAIAMFPVVSLVGPLFDMWTTIGLFNTWPGLIIPYMSFTLPLAIWTLSAFFREIPWEMEQAAQVDGATSWQAFRKVIVPLAAPGVFTAAILTFFFAWNEFVLAISLTTTTGSRTVPAQLSFFVGPDPFNPPYGQLATASVVVTVPIIIIVLLFQRKIVSGLTSGAVKG
ncbi:hypothetical protein LUZ63_019993 [Rhynchospora breviuscula]|uniref:ABC transmembrane type-1 domain-containing protein n=1 Tax=Rhynchospora breviuscula TaxID=2022672 RepID=A0A9Q0C136_9POAL|nr:hypothetical protein LUZ63_019993 [Rhynchospora breviuscula]